MWIFYLVVSILFLMYLYVVAGLWLPILFVSLILFCGFMGARQQDKLKKKEWDKKAQEIMRRSNASNGASMALNNKEDETQTQDEDDFEDDYADDNDNDNTADISLSNEGRVEIDMYDADISVDASTLTKAKELFFEKLRQKGKDPKKVKFEYESMDEEYYKLYDKVLTLVTEKHKGQRDKARKPYMGHIARVMRECWSPEAKIVALLHDIVEDTDVDERFLRSYGVPEEIIRSVMAITKREGEDYMDFIDRVANDEMAMEVKIADLEDNMDIRRLNNLEEEDFRRLQKYHNAWKLLKNKS